MQVILIKAYMKGEYMEIFEQYLSQIDDVKQKNRVKEILHWIMKRFPNLIPKISWNQPMFTDHGTFIIAFSIAKQHLAVAPERVVINQFSEEITKSGYSHSKELIRIPWESDVDLSLLERIIEFNIMDKAECETFWRK
jgi:uncharacterized protein YdhG (YjbR/CyaY superfamily)